MPLILTYQDLIVRLLCATLAGAAIGINREENGRAAGLRTTLLVCLAAAASMVAANLLLATHGKTPELFAQIDVMRLPLGILSGIGFIGGGAMLRRENLVTGITTAATLWYVTVMGLCFGGGLIGLGTVVLVLGLIVLWGLKPLEKRFPQHHHATFRLLVNDEGGPTEGSVRQAIRAKGFHPAHFSVTRLLTENRTELQCGVRWKTSKESPRTPDFLNELASHPGVIELQWKPLDK